MSYFEMRQIVKDYQPLCLPRPTLNLVLLFSFPDSVSAFSSMANNEVDNKGRPEMEYWNHQQHQWLDNSGKLTTTTDSTNEEELIPIFKKEANTTIITSAGQTVYLHCHVENLGERSVSCFLLLWWYMSRLKALSEASRHENSDQDYWKIN